MLSANVCLDLHFKLLVPSHSKKVYSESFRVVFAFSLICIITTIFCGPCTGLVIHS